MKVLLAAATLALSLGQAGAVCLSHDPLDPRCTVNDFLNPTMGSVSFYARNPAIRQAEIALCTAPGVVRRPDPSLVRSRIRSTARRQRRTLWKALSLMGGSTVAQTLWTGYSGVAQSAMSTVLGQMIPVVAAAMSGVLMLVVLIAGKNLMFGELPIGEAVTRSVRALVVSALLTVSTFNTYVATFFTQTVPNQLASAMSGGQAQAGAPAFDAMIDALTKIGAQTRAQMIGLQYIGDRVAEWVIEFAGKALISGCFLVWAVASLLVYFCVPLIALFAPMWLFDRTRAYGERAVGYVVGLVLVQALTLMVAAASSLRRKTSSSSNMPRRQRRSRHPIRRSPRTRAC